MLAFLVIQKEGDISMSSSDGSGGRQLRLEVALNDFEHFLRAQVPPPSVMPGKMPRLRGIGGRSHLDFERALQLRLQSFPMSVHPMEMRPGFSWNERRSRGVALDHAGGFDKITIQMEQ